MKDFIENKCSTEEAALDLTLSFLREMKQDEAADTLAGKRLMIVCHIVTYNVGQKIRLQISVFLFLFR